MDISLVCFACSVGTREVSILVGDFPTHNSESHSYFVDSCQKCPCRFDNPMDKDAHDVEAHLSSLCLECHHDGSPGVFMDEDEFHLHYLKEHPLCKCKCTHCPNYFINENERDKHISIWHCNLKTPKKVLCIHCKRFFWKKDLPKHNKDVHKGFRHECSRCGIAFRSSGELGSHFSHCKY